MAEVGSAFVSLLPSARGFGRKMQSQVGGEVDKAGKKLGRGFGKVFAVAGGAFAAAGVANFLKDSVKGAADLEQSVGAIDTVFKKSAGRMHDWAKGAAQDVGLTRNEFNELGTLIGTQLRNGGTAMDELAPKTNNLITLGADLSSMFGGTTKEAVEALSSALKGERDPIERYGVSLNQAKIDAEAAALGFEKVDGALTDQGKQAATLSLIMKQTTDAHGNFARESDTLAGKQQRLSAQWTNMKDTLGSALLPVLTDAAGLINERVLPAIGNFAGEARKLVDVAWGKLEAGVSALRDFAGIDFADVKAFARTSWGNLQGGIDALQRLTKLDLSEVDGGKLGRQLGDSIDSALASLGGMAGKFTKRISEALSKVDWPAVGLAIGKEAPAMLLTMSAGILSGDAMDNLGRAFADHWRLILLGAVTIALAPAKLIAPLTKALARVPFVGTFLAASVKWLNDLGSKFTKFGGDLMKSLWRGFTKAPIPGAGLVARIVGALKSLPGRLKDFFEMMRTRLGVWALDAFEAIGRGARTAIGGVLKWLAGIPGAIFRAIGSLARTLFPRGSEAIGGFLRALQARWSDVGHWLGGLAGRAISAVGNLGTTLYGAGQRLIDGLIAGIRSRIDAVASAMSTLASKVKGFLPGSPVKEGPLTSWNNGAAGVRLMDMVADGIRRGGRKVATSLTTILSGLERTANPLIKRAEAWGDKIADALGTKGVGGGLAKRLKGLREQVKGVGNDLGKALAEGMNLKDRFESLRDAVTSAFKSDWFSSIGTEAEYDDDGNLVKPAQSAVQNFLASLTQNKGMAEQVSAAFAKLKTIPGLSKEFLSALLSSGNSELILGLANGPASALTDANTLFGQVNAITDSLGTDVASNQLGDGIYAVRDEIRELRKEMRGLGGDVGKAINDAAARGHRAKKRQGKAKTK